MCLRAKKLSWNILKLIGNSEMLQISGNEANPNDNNPPHNKLYFPYILFHKLS